MSATEDTGIVTVREVVDALHDATERMSKKNKHRGLMLQAMSTIMQLYVRLEALEKPPQVKDAPRIELVTH